jgi:uncharacterized protein GlcG (DUF336 family)
MQTAKAEMSLELANFILSAALEKARSLRVLVNVAVFDAGLILKGFFRMGNPKIPGDRTRGKPARD